MPPKAKIKQSMSNISKTKTSTAKKKSTGMKKDHHNKLPRQGQSTNERSFDGDLQRKPSKAQISTQPSQSAPRRGGGVNINASIYSPSIAQPPPPPMSPAPVATPSPSPPAPPPQQQMTPAIPAPAPPPPQQPSPPAPLAQQQQQQPIPPASPPPMATPQSPVPPSPMSPVQQAALFPPAVAAATPPPPPVIPSLTPPPPRNDGSLYTNTARIQVQVPAPGAGGIPPTPAPPMEAVPVSPVTPMAPTPPQVGMMNVPVAAPPAPPPAQPPPPAPTATPSPVPNPHAGHPAQTPPKPAGGAIHHFQNQVLFPAMRNMVQALQPIINHPAPLKPTRSDGAGLDEPTGFNPDDDVSQVASQWMKKTLELGVAGLKKEYWETANETPAEKCATFKENPTKNRYWNIPCNDVTRFRLPDSPQFYIHANYVGSGSSNPRRFLCAQAPLVSTVEDFWRMVIASNTEYIVMLCDLVEKGKPKSAEYFPQKVGETLTIGNYCTVTKEHFQELDKTVTMAKLRITVINGDGQPYNLRHLHWHQWPDHGAPDHFISPFRVISQVRKSRRPILVHCSAGVGRTGTLVLIAIILEQIRSTDFPGVQRILTRMREDRFKLVQTEIQYLYVHRCMLDYFVFKNLCPHYSKEDLKKFKDDYQVAAEKCVV